MNQHLTNIKKALNSFSAAADSLARKPKDYQDAGIRQELNLIQQNQLNLAFASLQKLQQRYAG